MKRITTQARPDWMQKAEEVGFIFHSNGKPISKDNPYGTYWDESVYYQFTLKQIEEIEEATAQLHQLCLDAVDHVVNKDPSLLFKLEIPEYYHDYIKQSWNRSDPTLYGRFDLAYDGINPPQMLEYNADTPTLAIETGVFQWLWMEEVHKGTDQFNSLHDKLLAQFKLIKSRMPSEDTFWFAGYGHYSEEKQQLTYFEDLAQQAGLKTGFIDLKDIGWNGFNFTDLNEKEIKFCFKLYPWEWIMHDEFGKSITWDTTGWLEPGWKAILSNKGILPILYELFPNHKNILKASWNKEDFGNEKYFAKPILSREGSNIDLYENGKIIQNSTGEYDSKKIYQAAGNIFNQNGNKAVIGSWVVGHEPAGMIIRDGSEDIINSDSRVVPHIIVD